MLTEAQLKERKTGLGGTDAAAILGLSKFKTPMDVYFDKTSDLMDVKPNEAMQRGIKLEKFVKQAYIKSTGFHVDDVHQTYRHAEHDFMLANLDGWRPDNESIVEFKTASNYMKHEWGDPGTDEIPRDYLLQVAHYAIVKNVERVDIGVLFGDKQFFDNIIVLMQDQFSIPYLVQELSYDFRIYTYIKHKDLEDRLIEREHNFWHEHVLKRQMPELKTLQDYQKAFPIGTERKIEATPDIVTNLNSFSELKNRYQEEEKKIKLACVDTLKESSYLILNNMDDEKILASYRNKSRSSFDMENFKKDHPDLYEQYKKTTTYRELKINGIDA